MSPPAVCETCGQPLPAYHDCTCGHALAEHNTRGRCPWRKYTPAEADDG